jgi:hypothetical protein
MLVKKTKRREWTAEDVRELKQLARAKTPAGRIARKLKRTEGATRQKALTLNVSLDSRSAKPKTKLKKTSLKKTTAKQAALKKKATRKRRPRRRRRDGHASLGPRACLMKLVALVKDDLAQRFVPDRRSILWHKLSSHENARAELPGLQK